MLMLALVGCGGGSSKSNTPQTSKVTTRALVSNSFVSASTGGLQIIDYSKNQETTFQMGCCATWTRMLRATDGAKVYAVLAPPNTPGIGVFTMSSETETAFMGTSSTISAFTASSDDKFVFAAVRNGASTLSQPGSVEFADTTASTVTVQTVPVPLATGLALNHAGNKLLVFSDQGARDPSGVVDESNSLNLVDPTAKTATLVAGFDRPIAGFFSTDDSTAYVINCGAQCGGTQAGVAVVNMTATPPAIVTTVPVAAATVATLDNGTLYLAGTNATGGVLTLLTVSGTTVTASGNPIAIGDGVHQVLSVGNGKAFVGARTCSSGCLSIVDLNSKAVVVDTPKGDVTGAASIPKQNEFYVVEGGELRIYDTTTSQEKAGVLIDIVGSAQDVVVVDQ